MDVGLSIYSGTENEASLTALIADQVENLYLDYKCKANHESPEIDEALKKNLGRSLSGFANTDGGVYDRRD